jgi:hypothetical protein
MPRPHAVAISASPMPPVTAVTESSVLPMLRNARINPVTVPSRPSSGASVTGALEFNAGGELQRAQQRTVLVADVTEAVTDHADDRVVHALGNVLRGGDIAIFQRGEQLLQLLRVAPAGFTQPPERAFADDGDCDDGAGKNRPHDRAAFAEELKNDVCEHGIHGCWFVL